MHHVETLPRTESGKVDLFAVNAFLDVSPTEDEVDRWTFGAEPLPQTMRAWCRCYGGSRA